MSRVGSNRRRADGVRVDKVPRIEIQNVMTETQCGLEQFQGRIIFVSMYNDTAWWERNKELCIANAKNFTDYVKGFAGHWSLLRPGSEKMLRNSHVQSEWKMGSSRWAHDAQLQWKRTHRIPWIKCPGTRRFEKQRKRTIVFALLWRRQICGIGSSHDHLRQSAQYLRSSTGHVWRISLQNLWLFRTYRETCWRSLRTDGNVRRNLLQNYEQKFVNLPDHLQLI